MLGIEIGNENIRCGILKNNKIILIPDENHNTSISAYISFTENEILIGNSAKMQIQNNPKNTIYDLKHILGRKYDDLFIKQYSKFWQFKIEPSPSNSIYFIINLSGRTYKLFPEQILALFLSKIKQLAEKFLNIPIIKQAVIAGCFNNNQKQAIQNAGHIANIEIIKIISELGSCSLSYGLYDKEKIKTLRNLMILNFGSYQAEFAIICIEDDVFEVKPICGNYRLGGKVFTYRIYEYLTNKFKRKTGIDLTKNNEIISRLYEECEKAKIELSNKSQAIIKIPNTEYTFRISRSKFDKICMDIYKNIIYLIEKAILNGFITKDKISEILLLGNTAKTPRIQEIVQDYFGKILNSHDENSHESIISGAIIETNILDYKNNINENVKDFLLIDTLSNNISISTKEQGNQYIQLNNYPARRSFEITTISDNQSSLILDIYEHYVLNDEYNYIGKYEIYGLCPAPRGIPRIKVDIEINNLGILSVSAFEIGLEKYNQIIIRNLSQTLTREQIETLITLNNIYTKYWKLS